MRADVNVSVRPVGSTELGTRTETNVNSVRFIRQAIEFEARRQVELLEGGGEVVQETRSTIPIRDGRCARRKKRTTTATSRPDLLPSARQKFVDARLPTCPNC